MWETGDHIEGALGAVSSRNEMKRVIMDFQLRCVAFFVESEQVTNVLVTETGRSPSL